MTLCFADPSVTPTALHSTWTFTLRRLVTMQRAVKSPPAPPAQVPVGWLQLCAGLAACSLCTLHGLPKCQNGCSWQASLHLPPVSSEQVGPAGSQPQAGLGEAQSGEDPQVAPSGWATGEGLASGSLWQLQTSLSPGT